MIKRSWTPPLAVFFLALSLTFLSVFYVSYFFDESLRSPMTLTRQKVMVERTEVVEYSPLCEAFTLPPSTLPRYHCS